MPDSFILAETEEKITAVIPLTIPRSGIQTVMNAAIAEILSALSAQNISPTGPLFSYHLKRPSDMFNFEVGFPVNAPVTPTGRVTMSKLPATRVARTLYHGNYDGLAGAWSSFFSSIKSQGFEVQGIFWESYTTSPHHSSEPASWITELNCPLSS
jgi:effector-binding domain-containing protein